MLLYKTNNVLILVALFITAVFIKLYKAVHFKVLIFIVLKDAEIQDKFLIFI